MSLRPFSRRARRGGVLVDRGNFSGFCGRGRGRRFRQRVSPRLLAAGLDQPPVQRAETAVRSNTNTVAAAAAGRGAEARHLQPDAPDLAGRDLGLSEQLQGVRLERARVGGGSPEVEQLGTGVANTVSEILPRESHALVSYVFASTREAVGLTHMLVFGQPFELQVWGQQFAARNERVSEAAAADTAYKTPRRGSHKLIQASISANLRASDLC